MIDRKSAKQIAAEHVNRQFKVEGDELVSIDEVTIEKEYGWVFFFDSKRHVETGDFRYAIAGNGPVVVDRFNGSVTDLGTAQEVDVSLREFEAQRERAAC